MSYPNSKAFWVPDTKGLSSPGALARLPIALAAIGGVGTFGIRNAKKLGLAAMGLGD
jgi:hypothetical protein